MHSYSKFLFEDSYIFCFFFASKIKIKTTTPMKIMIPTPVNRYVTHGLDCFTYSAVALTSY